jgi:hypothetical protein
MSCASAAFDVDVDDAEDEPPPPPDCWPQFAAQRMAREAALRNVSGDVVLAEVARELRLTCASVRGLVAQQTIHDATAAALKQLVDLLVCRRHTRSQAQVQPLQTSFCHDVYHKLQLLN